MFLFEKEIQKAIQWCDEEDKILLKMKKRGQTWEEICKELPGRSHSACTTRYKILQVTAYFGFFFVLVVHVRRQYTGVGPLVDMKVWDQMLMSTNGPMMVN